MNKNNLIKLIKENTNVSLNSINIVFSEFKKIVLDALKKGEVINIKGFGKFFTRETGEKYYISPISKSKRLSENKVKPKFKFSSKLYF